MIPLVTNMLLKIQCADDITLFKAAIESTIDLADEIYILDTTPKDSEYYCILTINDDLYRWSANLMREKGKTIVTYHEPDYCTLHGFAAARNYLLNHSPEDCFIFYHDADEVHYPDQLQFLKDNLQNYDDIRAHFIHFCLGTNFFEKFEARTILFRRYPGTHWENKVHERVVHTDLNRRVFSADYHYFHGGYVRDQEVVYSRWHAYALLEGQKTPIVEQEYPDHRVLDHRRESLLPYFGEYPSSLPAEWVRNKMVKI
jgi:hypothetical protein